MQDLENAGFKLFTQMHRGQQKGRRKYDTAECRVQEGHSGLFVSFQRETLSSQIILFGFEKNK